MSKRTGVALAAFAIVVSGALYGLLRSGDRLIDTARAEDGDGARTASPELTLPTLEADPGRSSGTARGPVTETASPVPRGTPVAGGNQAAPGYDGEIAALLSSLLDEQPDLSRWTDYFARLASEAVLDPTTLVSSGEEFRGTLRVPDTDVAIEFTLDEESFTIAMKKRTDLDSAGPIAFRTSLSGAYEGNDLGAVYGSIQLYPSSEQRFYETRPVGFLYEMKDGSTSFCPMTATFENGHFAVSVPAREDYCELSYGNLQLPYQLLLRLRSLRPSGN